MSRPSPTSADVLKSFEEAQKGEKGFFDAMLGNQFFSAGVGVAGIGVGLTLVRRFGLSGLLYIQRNYTTSLEIASKDRSYQWVLQWVNKHTKGRTQHIGVETKVTVHDNGTHTTSFDYVPAPGRHFIWYHGSFMQIEREREKSMVDLSSGTPWETVKLTTFGRSRKIFDELLDEARRQALQKEEGKVVVYMPMMTDWRPFGRPRPRRPLSSVILDEGLAEHLESDIKEFHRGAKWYADRGIPHRRGYLLYGPPGSGKTSFIQALAGELGYNICVLNLNDRGLSDDRLLHLMTELPPRSLVLLEDIDAVFNKRESTYSVTFSGLLNALDGVTSAEERIVFMTTNHIDRLDPALIRPGRVDCKVYMGNSSPYQQRSMYTQFYPTLAEEAEEVDATDHLTATPHFSGLPRGFEDTRTTMMDEVKQLEARDAAETAEAVMGINKETKVEAEAAGVVVEGDSAAATTAEATESGEKVLKVGAVGEKNYDFAYKRGLWKRMEEKGVDDVAELDSFDVDLFSPFAEAVEERRQVEKLADQFVEALQGVEISMAELQGLMMVHKDRPRTCIRAARVLREQKVREAVTQDHGLEFQRYMQEQAQAKTAKAE